MNCGQVRSLLLAYLDEEVTPSERALILAHLSGCTVCQQEIDLLSTARSQVRSALQRRASQAVPSREAWSRLEARLPKMQVSFLPEVAQPPSNAKRMAWFSRKAPSAGHASNQRLGGVTMKKRWIFSGLVGVLALSVLAVLVAQTATPVSARQILDRAYEAQSAQNEGQGIQHTRIEIYQNLCARPEGQRTTIAMESYFDPQSGYFRTITTEAETGNVLEVLAFNGAQVHEGHRSVEVKGDQPEQGTATGRKYIVCDEPWGGTNEILTVYRSSQSSVASVNLLTSESVQTHEDLFQQMRKDPNAELLGEELWIDGRTVYVLRSRQPVKAIVEGSTELPMGWVVSYFDTESYKIVESRATIDRNGQELLVYSYRMLTDEILPAGSTVLWDLSDLQGITIVDDPDGQYVSLLPEVISEQQLASQSESAYLLKSLSDGFKLEISASPKQPADQPFIYVASYRNEAGDYFVIQSIGSKEVKLIEEGSSEPYTTASGLRLTFMNDVNDSSEKQFTSAVVETPEGVAFILSSTMSREQVKALAEKLVLVK
jgi:hypothetical protein